MRIGISTGCLYPHTTMDSLEKLLCEGFGVFEIFFNTVSEMENDQLDKIKMMLNRYSASVVSIHPFSSAFESFLLFSKYTRRFEDGVRMYGSYFRAAARLGADKLVIHGMKDDFAVLDIEGYSRRFARLCSEGEKWGVSVLQENVDRHCANRPDFLRGMAGYIPPQSGFVLDVKQALRGGYDPCELMHIMGSGLKHIHISDSTDEKNCLLPGKGNFDYCRFFRELKKCGYDGDIIIEVYGTSYKELSEIKKSKDFLESFI